MSELAQSEHEHRYQHEGAPERRHEQRPDEQSAGGPSGLPTEVALLSHLNRLLIRENELAGVAEAALDLLIALGAHSASVYIYRPERRELDLAGERNHPPDLIAEWQRLSLDEETLLTRAVRSGAIQQAPNLAAATHLPRLIDKGRRAGFRAALALPLVVEGEPIGALGCGLLQPLAEDDPRMAVLSTVAQGIAIAILHVRMAEEARQREVDQAMLADAAKLFNSTLDLRRTLRDVARIAALALGDACMILLVEGSGAELAIAASFHRDPEQAEHWLEAVTTRRPRVDEGPLAEIIRGRRPLNLSGAEVAALGIAAPAGPPMSCWLGAPIVYRGETLGVLTAFSTTDGVRFGERETRLATGLADSAAPAIANARLFRRVSGEHHFVQAVLDNLPEAVVIVDGDQLRVMVVNQAGRTLLGGGPAVGTPIAECTVLRSFRPPEGEPFALGDHPLARAARGESLLAQELVIRCPDGREVAVLANVAPVRDEVGAVIAAAAVMQDISRRRELDQEKDDFLAVAAHELRTPLTLIRGQLQLIARSRLEMPEELRERLAVVRDQAERMTELATRLLDVSRIGSGRLDLDLEPTDLSRLARELAERFQPRAAGRPITVRVPATPVVGRWDRSRLEEVLVNLLDNAIRYSPAGGRITLAVSDTPTRALLEVSDEGVGIAPEVQARLFERYMRAGQGEASGGSTRVETGAGMGLGLFICRSIVEAHGGTIGVRSAPGAGATFSVNLPRSGPTDL